MNIAFFYDNQEDYFLTDNIQFADFCLDDEAAVIVDSLQELGHTVTVIKGPEALRKSLHNINSFDLVFNKSEGFKSRNREGLVPAMLEYYNIPFTGTDAYGFSLSLNKYHTKLIALDNDILTPNFVVINSINEINKIRELQFPIIIKPNSEGSSIGCRVFYQNSKQEILQHINELVDEFNQPVIVEEYIKGIDVSVPIIGNKETANCLGIVEFSCLDGSYPEIASTDIKYVEGFRTKIIEDNTFFTEKIKSDSLKIYNALGCNDYARVDFRITEDAAYFLEINPLPTLFLNGAFDVCAKSDNQNIKDVIKRIVDSAIERYIGKKQ